MICFLFVKLILRKEIWITVKRLGPNGPGTLNLLGSGMVDGGRMKWINCRGGFVMYHPPPSERNKALLWSKVYTQILKINLPPPSTENLGIKQKTDYGTKERRPRRLGPTPRGVPCKGLDPEKLTGGTGYFQDLRQPDMEWIRPARAEDTPPSGRTWI